MENIVNTGIDKHIQSSKTSTTINASRLRPRPLNNHPANTTKTTRLLPPLEYLAPERRQACCCAPRHAARQYPEH
jgi:hypothetical protein